MYAADDHSTHGKLKCFYYLFSKRRFVEQQAEEWWKENKDRLYKKYSPAKPTKSASMEALPTQPPVADQDNPSTHETN